MEIYRLDVSRQQAGRVVPFDRLYLATGSSKAVLKRMFKYAIVMPFTNMLRDVFKESASVSLVDAPRTSREVRRPIEQQTAFNIFNEDWIVVLPIASNIGRSKTPEYLTNARWVAGQYYMQSSGRRRRGRQVKKVKDPLPVLSYLQTPERNYRPVCVACPRFIEHQAGMCELGMRVCYDSLLLGEVLPPPEQSSYVAPADVREDIDAQ